MQVIAVMLVYLNTRYVSNKGNPAAQAHIGTSAAAERGMRAWIMRLNMRGMGGFPTSRASIYSVDFR